jgi:hypothetical protein
VVPHGRGLIFYLTTKVKEEIHSPLVDVFVRLTSTFFFCIVAGHDFSSEIHHNSSQTKKILIVEPKLDVYSGDG